MNQFFNQTTITAGLGVVLGMWMYNTFVMPVTDRFIPNG